MGQKFKVVFQGGGGELDHRIVDTPEEIGDAIRDMIDQVGADALTEDDGFYTRVQETNDEGEVTSEYPSGWARAGV